MELSKFKTLTASLIMPLFLSIPCQYLSLLAVRLLKSFNLPFFYSDFFFPQLIYPLLFLSAYLFTVKVLLKKDFAFLPLKGNLKGLSSVKSVFLFISTAIVVSTLYGKFLALINSKTEIIKPLQVSLIRPEGLLEEILFLFVMSVIPATVEETVFRGVILSGFSKAVGKYSILISSLLFALMHANFNQIPVAFVMGLLLSYFAYRNKSLLLPIIIHFFNNFFSSLFKVLQLHLSEELFYLIDSLTTALFIAVSLLILLVEFFRKNKKKLFEEEEKTDKGLVKASFLNVGFITYALMNLFVAISLNL